MRRPAVKPQVLTCCRKGRSDIVVWASYNLGQNKFFEKYSGVWVEAFAQPEVSTYISALSWSINVLKIIDMGVKKLKKMIYIQRHNEDAE